MAGGRKLREQLTAEGITEFRSIVLKSNTRVQRAMQAAGWDMEPDPNDSNILNAVLRQGG